MRLETLTHPRQAAATRPLPGLLGLVVLLAGVAVLALWSIQSLGLRSRADDQESPALPSLTPPALAPRTSSIAASPLILRTAAPVVRRAGIIQMRQGPFSPMDFLVRNVWQGQVGPDWALVYAGVQRDLQHNGPNEPPGKQAVRLYTEALLPTLGLTEIGTFFAPQQKTQVRLDGLSVTAVSGDRMELHADDGKPFVFNLVTNQFE